MAVSKSIDIIIPTYARPGAASTLVDSLKPHLTSEDRVYIVCQDVRRNENDTDDRISYLHSAPPNLPRARNTGLAAGKGEIVLFLDDDVEVLDDRILTAHRRAYEDGDVGAVAGFIEDRVFPAHGELCSVFNEATGELIQNFSLTRKQEALSVMGAHMSFKRTALERIGGFDDQYKKNALWEDVDCAFRLRRAGWKIMFYPDAKVRHVREARGGCRTRSRLSYTYHQFANTAYFAGRFAEKRYYRSWARFWKYRLEYVSRASWLGLRHDPLVVAAGALGATAGIVRFLLFGTEKSTSV